MSEDFPIGELASRTGVAASALRYYEERGLLTPARRVGRRRHYTSAALHRVGVISACQRAGFTLEEIQQLLSARAPGSHRLMGAKLAELDARIEAARQAKRLVEQAMRCDCASLDGCGLIAADADPRPVAQVAQAVATPTRQTVAAYTSSAARACSTSAWVTPDAECVT